MLAWWGESGWDGPGGAAAAACAVVRAGAATGGFDRAPAAAPAGVLRRASDRCQGHEGEPSTGFLAKMFGR